jgi:hypothetical protein
MRRRCMMRMRIVITPALTKMKNCRKRVDAYATRPQKKMLKMNHTICAHGGRGGGEKTGEG